MKNSANMPLRVIAFVSPHYSKMICGCLQFVLKYVVYTFESTLSAGTLDQFIFTKKPNNSKIVSEFRPAQAAETENKDTHHRTHWKRRWSEGRSWLVYDFDKKVMFLVQEAQNNGNKWPASMGNYRVQNHSTSQGEGVRKG